MSIAGTMAIVVAHVDTTYLRFSLGLVSVRVGPIRLRQTGSTATADPESVGMGVAAIADSCRISPIPLAL